jgi:hypothetical protein
MKASKSSITQLQKAERGKWKLSHSMLLFSAFFDLSDVISRRVSNTWKQNVVNKAIFCIPHWLSFGPLPYRAGNHLSLDFLCVFWFMSERIITQNACVTFSAAFTPMHLVHEAVARDAILCVAALIAVLGHLLN